MAYPNRIDVHQHVVPPFWADQLPSHGGDPSGTVIPEWSPEEAIAFMDRQGIATGILSLTAPGVGGWQGRERALMARRVNEYTASLVARHPGRFGVFATVPVGDTDASLAEIAYAFDTLKADGVILLSNMAGHYIGEPDMEPVWAELNRRRAIVFVHPGQPQISAAPGVASPMVDYPFDTTRAAAQLVVNGVTTRHPEVRFILSHAGGFLPYAAHRIAELAKVFNPDALPAKDIIAEFRRFYFDTALSAGPAAFPTLTAFAEPGHILFGSDFPHAPEEVGKVFTDNLDGADLCARQITAINRDSASLLFPRLLTRAPTDVAL